MNGSAMAMALFPLIISAHQSLLFLSLSFTLENRAALYGRDAEPKTATRHIVMIAPLKNDQPVGQSTDLPTV
jgi:hypothetical protein